MTDASLRRATRADAPLLLELMREYYAFDHLAFDEVGTRAGLLGLLDDEAVGEAWLAFGAAGEPLGYALLVASWCVELHGRTLIVDELYLRAGARGQGLGRRLLEQAEAVARLRGAKALRLEVERTNTAASAVYVKLGYVAHPRDLMSRVL